MVRSLPGPWQQRDDRERVGALARSSGSVSSREAQLHPLPAPAMVTPVPAKACSVRTGAMSSAGQAVGHGRVLRGIGGAGAGPGQLVGELAELSR